MNCEIFPINENSWRIEDSGVRCFLLTGSEKALLIDSGRELHTARDIAESLTDSLLRQNEIKAWDGKLPAYMNGGGSTTIPVLRMDGETAGTQASGAEE